jgi:nucleoside-triphosphatase
MPANTIFRVTENTKTMPPPDNILLLTGIPGIGKTTVVKKIVASFADLNISGFYTEEIRARNMRQGFALVTLNGERIVMAHIDCNSAFRVGKYSVDITAIDKVVRTALTEKSDTDLFIIDEIGKMECFSTLFVKKMKSLLDSGKKPVVATIALKGTGFIAEMKNRPGILCWDITKKNRDEMPESVVGWIREKGKRY